MLDVDRSGFGAFAYPSDVKATPFAQRLTRLASMLGFQPVFSIDVDAEAGSMIARHFALVVGDTSEKFQFSADATIIFTIDVFPRPARPGAVYDNGKVGALLKFTRALVDEAAPEGVQVGFTAASRDAWSVLGLVAPDRVSALQREVEQKQGEVETETPMADLSRSATTAKVELIGWKTGKAVRKTYRTSARERMQAELQVLRELEPLAEIPALFAAGDNFIVTEHVSGREIHRRRRSQPQPLPLRRVRQLRQALERCVAAGFDPIDLTPAKNVIFHENGVSLFDFEYWRKSKPSSVGDTYCLSGVPPEDGGDRPLFSHSLFGNPYPISWFPYVCLSKQSFLHDPLWLQRLKRPWFILVAYLQWGKRIVGGNAPDPSVEFI